MKIPVLKVRKPSGEELPIPAVRGPKGGNGADGKDGRSAYEVAVANGFKGSEEEWLKSLKGAGFANYIPGDVDGNGVVNSIDAMLVRQYVAGQDVDIYLPAADVNGDGKITEEDAQLILDYDALKDVELKYSPLAGGVSAKVEQTDDGAVITIVDYTGTTTAVITNGKDGKDGVGGSIAANYIPGDVDGNGVANSIDAMYVMQYLEGQPVDIYLPAADVNGDGKITMEDVELILAYDALEDVELKYSPLAGGVSAKVEQTAEGATITITDMSGTTTANVKDGAKGDKGDPGVNGTNGKDGVTPAFSIGSVSTLAPGSAATASITGTAANPILNLGIPRGADGAGGSGSAGVAYIPGDVDGNGVVNSIDVMYVMQYLDGQPVDIFLPAADVNGDGKITMEDAELISAYDALKDVELKYSPLAFAPVHPIGSVYLCVQGADRPANLWGGTWEQIDIGLAASVTAWKRTA